MGKVPIVIGAIVLVLLGANVALVQQNQMSFFVTSVGSGMGGNLGGLAGADKYCQTLATALGAGSRTWRAYLSTQARPGQPAVNARDRIGKGPWFNSKERIPRRVRSRRSPADRPTRPALDQR